MNWRCMFNGVALLLLGMLSPTAAAHYRVGWLPDPPYLSGASMAPTGEDILQLQALLPALADAIGKARGDAVGRRWRQGVEAAVPPG